MSLPKGTIIHITSAFVCFLHYLGAQTPAHGHGAIHEQIQDVTRQIGRDSTNAELYLQRGELYRYDRDWAAALSDFDRAAALDPELALVDLARGKTLYEAGQLEPAKLALDRFLLQQPHDVEALLTRARVLRNLGQNLAAAVDYGQAIENAAEPRPEYYLERARVLVDAGDDHLSSALAGLDEGLNRLGAIVTLQLYAIELEVRRQAFDAALERLDTVARQAPRKEKWLFRRAEILAMAGRTLQARTALQQALQKIETLPARLRNRRTTVMLEKQIRSAMENVEHQLNMERKNGAS